MNRLHVEQQQPSEDIQTRGGDDLIQNMMLWPQATLETMSRPRDILHLR